MVIKKVISLFDTQAKVFCAPFNCVTLGEGIRSFSDAVNDPSTGILNKHPQDFILYEIAEFDDSSGIFTAKVPPNRLGLGTDFVLSKRVPVSDVSVDVVDNGKEVVR